MKAYRRRMIVVLLLASVGCANPVPGPLPVGRAQAPVPAAATGQTYPATDIHSGQVGSQAWIYHP